jgi:hypothetical protein
MVDAGPIGQRFSQTYLASPELLPDSMRMRRRIGHLIGDTFLRDFPDLLAKELGIPLDRASGTYDSYWPTFLGKIAIGDVLDTITIRYRSLSMHFYDADGSETAKAKRAFLNDVRRIFAEERVRYRIDDGGGVHFTIDEAFENVRIAAVTQLGQPRYAGARHLFEEAFLALDGSPPDGKGAIRSIFFAAENLFRLMFPSSAQLNAGEVLKNLKPVLDSMYSEQKPAVYVAQKQISAFREWIDGAHFYRHEPGTEDPAQPPLDLAIYMVSQGMAHIRWLIKIDESRSK